MENFDKLYSPKMPEYRNCESCGGVGCPDCYGTGFSTKDPEFDKAKEEYLKLKRSMEGIEDDERHPLYGEMVRTANDRLGELDRKFPTLKDLPELKDLKENKLTTMEKKLITEMKFMMERLESPRLTYTEYEKKHKLLTEDSEKDRLSPEARRERSLKAGIKDKKNKKKTRWGINTKDVLNVYIDTPCLRIFAPKSQVKEFYVSIECNSSLLGIFVMDIENKKILNKKILRGDSSVTFNELVDVLKEIKLTLVGGETNAYDKLIDLINQGWGTTKF